MEGREGKGRKERRVEGREGKSRKEVRVEGREGKGEGKGVGKRRDVGLFVHFIST